jgi:hypothetical protein
VKFGKGLREKLNHESRTKSIFISTSFCTSVVQLHAMPSKKKTKKGPRKAAEADRKVGCDNNVEAIVAVDSQMQRLKIDKDAQEDAFLEEAIKLAAAETKLLKGLEKCNHGYSSRSPREHSRCDLFACTYVDALFAATANNLFHEAETATEKIFPGVWENTEKLELIKSYFLFHGAEAVLHGDTEMAQQLAFVANYLEQWVSAKLRRTKVVKDPAKGVELLRADEHTLVRFFTMRIPCSCLDEKYEGVKSIKKMGFCCNPTCRMGRLNAAPCLLALDVVGQTNALKNVKHKTGKSIRRTAIIM